MEWREKAAQCFQNLIEEAGANHCAVQEREQGTWIDAGWDVPGGWMAAKCVLEGLSGGRGQVSYTQRQMADGMQIPALELFLDDPVGTARAFQRDEQGIYGVRGEEGYVLGVTDRPLAQEKGWKGNVVSAGPNSLFTGIMEAADLMAQCVQALEREGVSEILWGWSSCPLAAMTQDAEETRCRRLEMAKRHTAISLWVRGEGSAIRRAIESMDMEEFFVHELVTACTYGKR
ncbi:methenyltetrahydromethanopterin cyclohydrolase [Pseudoflavonifractor hominis]|uniref:Methenyltetrahydromethanopterin cyclohydrolase n=1 Tax=Pseudoflavonifractor hominis TaxID=2763059 RepID=A0ABR7HVI6_9FIRM|nr:methenyltetrahydromethanopterin cyclohydrolase [Pseudoflavonifractor hominis]MBC5731528.1 hypothetical protein [Pseudoflavonifractor hominis]